MKLELFKIQAISEIANFLYDFLPGKPHPYADQSLSFKGVAYSIDLGDFWQDGSKLPAITNLIERTLEFRANKFTDLMLEIVKRGIKYRANKNEEITREEIEELNKLILKANFKIPELWEKSFLDALPSKSNKSKEEKSIDQKKLQALKTRLIKMNELHPQTRGYDFEKFLQELFEIYALHPKSPFKIVGEQIDGSIEIDNHTYLIEAKWQNSPLGQGELLKFYGKVGSKSTWSRGLFISYSGFTEEGLEAFSKGKPTNLIAMDGEDLCSVLDNEMTLSRAIILKSRRAAETGEIMVKIRDLKLIYRNL